MSAPAERARICDEYLGEIERSGTHLTVGLVWRLSKALQVGMLDLFLFSVANRSSR